MTAPRVRIALLLACLCGIAAPLAGAQRNAGKEYRSLNTDVYHIEIQKNGQVDVFLGAVQPAVFDAFPMIWFADDSSPKRMKTDGRWTQRYRVEDRLGEGQGMLQRYKEMEWTLRAYPTRSFLAVQVAYTNTGKKPVTVRALMPWCVGDPGKGAITLGPGTEGSVILTDFASGRPQTHTGQAIGPDAIALYNATTGRSLIAGFVTQNRAASQFEVGAAKSDEESAFYQFRAVCEFDPPVTVEPGEQLASEVLYIALGETDPVVGVERYARAVTVANTAGPRPAPFRAWDVSAGPLNDFSQRILDAQRVAGPDFVPFALFTESASLPSMAGAARAAGLRVALWRDPFAYAPEDALVRERPDWFIGGGTPRTPDLGNQEVQDYLAAAARRLAESGIQAIAGVDLGRLQGIEFSGSKTRTEVISAAVRAIRGGLGESGLLYATAPSLLASTLTDGVVAQDMTPERMVASSSIAPGSLTLNTLSDQASPRVLLTVAAMTNQALLLDLDGVPGAPGAAHQLAMLSPSLTRPAAPADLFASDRPRVLHVTRENKIGTAHVVAVFNWRTDQAESTSLPLGRLGGERGVYYSVYDYWSGKYLGAAIEQLGVTVAPGDVTVLVLRPLLQQPMPLAIGANLGQSTPQIDSYTWDPANALLRVATSASTAYTLPILLPEGLDFDRADASVGQVNGALSADAPRVVQIEVSPDESGSADFVLAFKRR